MNAEELNLRATGIGCFFDAAVANVFGLQSSSFNPLYHLAIGKPIEDHRIVSSKGY